MTDETKPETWEQREAKRVAEARAWEFERDDRNEQYRAAADVANHERIKERDAILSKLNDERCDRMVREETAATILAAFITAHSTVNDGPAALDIPPTDPSMAVAMAAALDGGES